MKVMKNNDDLANNSSSSVHSIHLHSKNTSPFKVSLASSSFLETLVFVFLSEFQDLLYDVVRQGIVGALEIDEVVSFLNELLTLLVRSIF